VQVFTYKNHTSSTSGPIGKQKTLKATIQIKDKTKYSNEGENFKTIKGTKPYQPLGKLWEEGFGGDHVCPSSLTKGSNRLLRLEKERTQRRENSFCGTRLKSFLLTSEWPKEKKLEEGRSRLLKQMRK